MKTILYSGGEFVTAPIDLKAQARLEEWLRDHAAEIAEVTGVPAELLSMPTFMRGFWAEPESPVLSPTEGESK